MKLIKILREQNSCWQKKTVKESGLHWVHQVWFQSIESVCDDILNCLYRFHNCVYQAQRIYIVQPWHGQSLAFNRKEHARIPVSNKQGNWRCFLFHGGESERSLACGACQWKSAGSSKRRRRWGFVHIAWPSQKFIESNNGKMVMKSQYLWKLTWSEFSLIIITVSMVIHTSYIRQP